MIVGSCEIDGAARRAVCEQGGTLLLMTPDIVFAAPVVFLKD